MEKHKSVFAGLIVATISFILMFIGIRFINNTEVTIQNIVYYVLFSSMLGGVAAVFCFYKLKYALIFFIIGIAIGYFELFRSLTTNSDGWGDLAGLLSLFMLITTGLITGIIVQTAYHFYKKHKK